MLLLYIHCYCIARSHAYDWLTGAEHIRNEIMYEERKFESFLLFRASSSSLSIGFCYYSHVLWTIRSNYKWKEFSLISIVVMNGRNARPHYLCIRIILTIVSIVQARLVLGQIAEKSDVINRAPFGAFNGSTFCHTPCRQFRHIWQFRVDCRQWIRNTVGKWK